MSAAVYIGPCYERRMQWFECPRCRIRQEVTDRVWAEVEVLGPKPTLDCVHRPHVPPSPATVKAFERAKTYADLLLLVAEHEK